MFASALCLLVAGCQSYPTATPRSYLEADHQENYRRAFGTVPPTDVEVLNSVVVDYAWRPGVVTTDDWEFELLAPRSWVEEQSTALHLRQVEADRFIERRKAHPIRAWYAPEPIEVYQLYFSHVTSIPYVHMLVEREPRLDSRHRIFISKH